MLVGGWWADRFAARLNHNTRPRVLGWILGLSVWALLTNHNFISYPNLINFSRNPMVDPLVALRSE